jgi:hypothetical protein
VPISLIAIPGHCLNTQRIIINFCIFRMPTSSNT